MSLFVLNCFKPGYKQIFENEMVMKTKVDKSQDQVINSC